MGWLGSNQHLLEIIDVQGVKNPANFFIYSSKLRNPCSDPKHFASSCHVMPGGDASLSVSLASGRFTFTLGLQEAPMKQSLLLKQYLNILPGGDTFCRVHKQKDPEFWRFEAFFNLS